MSHPKVIVLHPTKGFRSAPIGWRSRPHIIYWTSDHNTHQRRNDQIQLRQLELAREAGRVQTFSFT